MKYEYKTISYDAGGIFGGKVNESDFEAMLNRLGAEGWELVNCLASNVTYGKTAYIVAVFKRIMD